MADRTSTLNLVIAGNNKGAISAVHGLGGEVDKTGSKFKSLGAGLAGAFSVGAVIAGGKKILDGYEAQAGAVAKIKRLTGESAKDSSLLAFAAQQAGVQGDKAATSYAILAKNIRNGKLEAEGIVTKDSNGNLLSFDQILKNVAEKIHSLPPGFQRTSEALALFGKGGADMVKILGDGASGIDKQREKMKALGLELDDAALDKYGKFIHAQRDVKASLTGLEVQIGGAMVPVLTTFAHGITDTAKALNGLPGPVKTVGVIVAGLGVAAAGTTVAVGALGPVVSRGIETLTGFAGSAGEAASASDALAVSMFPLVEAEQAAATEAALTAIAIDAQTAALAAGATVVDAATAGIAARTLAEEGMVVADEAATVSAVGLSAALGPAAIAAAGLGAAYVVLSGDADRAKENVDALAGAAAAGSSATEEFDKKLAATLSGSTGGFALDISGDDFRRGFDAAGVSAKKLKSLLAGSDSDFDAFQRGLYRRQNSYTTQFASQLGGLRSQLKKAGVTAADQKRILEELGVTTGGTADKTKELADAAKVSAAQMDGQLSAAQKLADFEAGQADAALSAFTASQTLASSKSDVADKQKALNDAEKSGDPKAIAAARRDLAAAIVAQAQAVGDLADANDKVAGKTLSASDRARYMKDELDKLHKSTGFWNDDLATLEQQLGDVAIQAKQAADNLVRVQLLLAYAAFHRGQGTNSSAPGDLVPGQPLNLPSTPTPVVGGQHKPFSNGPADSARSLVHIENMHLSSGHVRDFNDTIRAAERRQDDRRRALDTKRHVA
jgi:hypothetical protein